MKFGLALGLTALIAVLGPPLLAKGPTVKLTITGPTLQHPLDITDPRALVNVYSDDFFAAPAAEPGKALPRYAVSFHVELPRGEGVKVMYVVRYAHDPITGKSYVYLPGRGDAEWYNQNVGTILREGQDGHWYEAGINWSAAINARLWPQSSVVSRRSSVQVVSHQSKSISR